MSVTLRPIVSNRSTVPSPRPIATKRLSRLQAADQQSACSTCDKEFGGRPIQRRCRRTSRASSRWGSIPERCDGIPLRPGSIRTFRLPTSCQTHTGRFRTPIRSRDAFRRHSRPASTRRPRSPALEPCLTVLGVDPPDAGGGGHQASSIGRTREGCGERPQAHQVDTLLQHGLLPITVPNVKLEPVREDELVRPRIPDRRVAVERHRMR